MRLQPNSKARPVGEAGMPLFRSGPKTPQELVKSMKDALQVLKAEQSGSKKGDKASELDAMYTQYIYTSYFRLLKRWPSYCYP